MFLKVITGSFRSLGMILFFLFAIACIFGSILVQEMDSSNFFSTFLNYTVSFENRFYDFRMRSNLDTNFRSKEITLVKIDDYSLQKLGVWPIPRTFHAQMIDKLGTFGAKVISFDVLFPEKSPPMGGVDPDLVLAASINKFQAGGGRVFLAYTLSTSPEDVITEPPVELLYDVIQTRTEKGANFLPQKLSRYNFPIEELIATEAGFGSISMSEDSDGIFRHYNLVSNVDTIYYGSLALNSFEAFTGEKNTISIFSDGSGELEIGDQQIEINRSGKAKIRYVGAEEQFPSVSLYDLLSAPDDDPKMRGLIEGKIIFVGSTALGAHDLRPSPLDAKMPGVYSHMNVTHMLLHKFFPQKTNESVRISLIFLIIGMILFLWIQKFGNPFLDAAIIISLMISCYYLDEFYFLPRGYELKLFYTFFCFVSCYSWNTFLRFYEANKEKKQIKGTFARYVAPTVVDEMLKDPDKLHVGGSKMDITCLFSDVRDFTRISEGLTATELAHSLNLYMGEMTDIVFETKGTLDKYIGDAIVAIWGAPLEIGNHAQYAVEAAIRMMETLPAINEKFKELNRPQFKIGIGLNSGECSVGNMGSERIFSYTALGDNMNLGARLESLCKHYGAEILISDFTLERLDLTHIKTRPIDKVVVKGKTKAVGIHEVLYKYHRLMTDPKIYDSYLLGYQAFTEKRFHEALEIFDKILLDYQDKSSERFRNLCKKFLESPELVGEDFEITVMTEK